jgi:hypothetical protein
MMAPYQRSEESTLSGESTPRRRQESIPRLESTPIGSWCKQDSDIPIGPRGIHKNDINEKLYRASAFPNVEMTTSP